MPKTIFKILVWLILGSVSFGVAYGDNLNLGIPGDEPPEKGPFGAIGNLYQLALGVSGLLAFGSIVYGAIVYTLAAGNPGGQNEGKEWIKQALLGLLLLVGAYIILNTINPALVRPGLSDALVPIGERPPLAGAVRGGSICDDYQALAADPRYGNGAAYPARNAPDLIQLMNCIESKFQPAPLTQLGSAFTYEIQYSSCNYTRGVSICQNDCSHAINSCHYGGAAGTRGALAVDYGNEAIGGRIIDAAVQCGAKAARCEDSDGNNVGRSGSACNAGASHVHITAATCDAN